MNSQDPGVEVIHGQQFITADGTGLVDGMSLDEAAFVTQGGMATQYILAGGEGLDGLNAATGGQSVTYLDGGYTMAIPVQGADGETVYLQGVELDQIVGDGQEMVLVSAEDAEALQSATGASGMEALTSGQQWPSSFGEQIHVFGEDDGTGTAQFLDLGGGQYQVMEVLDPLPTTSLATAKDSTSAVAVSGGGITYRCPSCPAIYSNANAFTKHMREKHFVKVYTCRQCEEFFETLTLLFLHARRTHVDPKKPKKNPANYKFHCDQCNYMTNNAGTMEHHKRAHTGEKPYECDFCGKRFAQKANMKTHRNRHVHRERIFRCDTCLKAFTSYDIYLAHLRTREHELREHFQMMSSSTLQLECLGCMQSFDSIYNLNKHTRSCRIVRTLQTKFRCIPCEAYIADVSGLKGHIKSHEGSAIITCPVCGERGFPGFNQLNHHITRAHALKVTRRFVCRYCESTFESKEEMLSHINEMHSEERNARQSRGAVGRLKCRFRHCDFTTNSMILLDRHHDNHTKRAIEAERKRLAAIEKAKTVGSTSINDSSLKRPTEESSNVNQKTITIFKANDDVLDIFDHTELDAKDIDGQDSDSQDFSNESVHVNQLPSTSKAGSSEASGDHLVTVSHPSSLVNTSTGGRRMKFASLSRPVTEKSPSDQAANRTRGRPRRAPAWYKDYQTPRYVTKGAGNKGESVDFEAEEEEETEQNRIIEKMIIPIDGDVDDHREVKTTEEWDIVVFDGQETMEDVLSTEENELILIKQEDE